MKRYLLLGGTRGMGRSLARLLAERGEAIALLGRDEEALKASAEDLRIRGAGEVSTALLDLAKSESFQPALDQVAREGPVDWVVVTAAAFATQEALEHVGISLL